MLTTVLIRTHYLSFFFKIKRIRIIYIYIYIYIYTHMCADVKRNPKTQAQNPPSYEGSRGTNPIKQFGPQRDPTYAIAHGSRSRIEAVLPDNRVM